jgi:hypothetical protein
MPVMPTEGDEPAGYGNPPKHSQFAKGRSGNPKGRPKGPRNIGQVFRNELNRRIPVSENGKHQTITKLEATIKQMVNKAASGDARAINTLLQLARELGDLELSTIAESCVFTINICNLPKGLQDKKP